MLEAIVKDRPIMSSLSQHSNELLALGGNKFPLNSHKGTAFSAGVSELFCLSACTVPGYSEFLGAGARLWMGMVSSTCGDPSSPFGSLPGHSPA